MERKFIELLLQRNVNKAKLPMAMYCDGGVGVRVNEYNNGVHGREGEEA